MWSNASNLKFTEEKIGKVHIEMRFVRGENKYSDGAGGVLGRARFPRNGGNIYFDDEENWTLDVYSRLWHPESRQANLLWVATHEIGHALGLDHSDKRSAIMYQYYSFEGMVRLDIDDIQAIQALYGLPGLPRLQYQDMFEVDIDTANLM